MMMRTALLATLMVAAPALAMAQDCAIPASPKGNDVAARIGKQTISVAELDAAIAGDLCQARMELAKKEAELRTRMLDQMIAEKVLTAEAQVRGLAGAEALIEKEVVEGVPMPPEADIKAFYEANKGQMGGASLEDMAPRIAEHLVGAQRQAAFDTLIKGLRHKQGVTVALEPFRMPVKAEGPAKGPADAPVTIVSYADFECPYCARGAEILEAVRTQYPKQVRLVFRDFPLDFHANAVPAAIAARCAGQQGKYYEMHDKLFADQKNLTPPAFKAHATAIGLDMAKFDACYADPTHLAGVSADQASGRAVGVEGTPAFFVNGIPISGAQPAEAFIALVEAELARKGRKK